jgi:acyl-ACP thioesterase
MKNEEYSLSLQPQMVKDMMTKENVGSYRFLAEPFHVDCTGRLTMSIVGNHLLNCAGMHAAKRGFGITDLNEHHYTWVLSRLAMEFKDLPMQYDEFSIDTWVEAVYSLFTDRNFSMHNAKGEAIGYARSVWAMIDLDSRRPVNLVTMHEGRINEYICTDRECPIEKPGRIKVVATEPLYSFAAKYSDIDINGHVNSVRYIEHILDLLPLEKHKTERLKRFEIAYITESYFGDQLDIYMDEDKEENVYMVEVRKHFSGEVVCRAKMEWKEMKNEE